RCCWSSCSSIKPRRHRRRALRPPRPLPRPAHASPTASRMPSPVRTRPFIPPDTVNRSLKHPACSRAARDPRAVRHRARAFPMIRRLIHFALHQPLFLFLILATFIGAGVVAFKTLPIEAFPDVSDIQVTVISLYPGRASEEVEKQVTIPVEVALAGVPHCVRMFSHTQFGLSFVVLTFDERVTDYFARQQVMERLTGADL